MKNLNFLTDLRNSDQVITRLRPGNNQVKTTLRFIALLTLILTIGVGQMKAEVITLTKNSLGTDGGYHDGAEQDATIGTVDFTYVNLMTSGNNIQVKASTGEWWNTSIVPGKITNVSATHSGTARNGVLYWGTSAKTTSNNATANGSFDCDSPTGCFGYVHYKRSNSSVGYWSSVVITYTPATITPSPTSITGLNYNLNNGPSDAQTFTVSGSNIPANLVVTAPTNFEVSLNGSSWASSQTISVTTSGSSGGTLGSTTVYVRLASGKSAGNYSGNVSIKIDGANDKTGITPKTVAVSGTVSAGSVAVTGVTVDPTSKSIVPGETFDITPTISPSNATDKVVSWTSGPTTYATVSNGTVTGVAAGSSTITCTTHDGGYTATCTVTVRAVTMQARDEAGNEIGVGGPGAPSRTGASISPAADAGNYVFKEWQITNASLGSSASTKSNTITNPTGAVTVTAVYYKPITITYKANNQVFTTQTYGYGGTLAFPVSNPTPGTYSCDGKTFVGWVGEANKNYSHATTAPTYATAGGSVTTAATYYAVFAIAGAGGTTTKTDELTYTSFFNACTSSGSNTNGSYTSFSNKSGSESDAVYAGFLFQHGNGPANCKDYIQMKSKDNVSGIITTTSGGKAKKVTVEWNSTTANAKVLNIYGKSTAYSAASDLYADATDGDLLGTITKGTSTEYTITGDYEHIGLRSSDGSVYFDAISIDWQAGGGVTYSDYTTSCVCTAPEYVTISGAWDKFGGETISLTATPYDDGDNEITTGITGWKWQKLVSSTWTDIENGTSDGVTTSGATSQNLQISNCKVNNSGKYRCVVSTGATCSTASATATDGSQGHLVRVYALECYTGGTTVYNFTRTGNSQAGTVQVTLAAGTQYQFKIHGDAYFGNNGTINEDVTNWDFEADKNNVKVESGLGGTFTFAIDYSANGAVPDVSVTYPRKTIYFSPGVWNTGSAKFAIYYFRKVGETIYGEGFTDFISANDCGSSTEIPQWNGVKINVVRLNSSTTASDLANSANHYKAAWDKKWNQTSDILVNSNNYISITDWGDGDSPYSYGTYSTPTYTISYNAGTNGTNTRSNDTKTCGVDFTLPNTQVFTRNGYTMDGWATEDGGSKVYELGGNYTTNADQTFYPHWALASYGVTLNTNGGTINAGNVTSYTYGTGATLPTDVTKAHATFQGWYASSTFEGDRVYTIGTTEYGDKQYYAKWEDVKWTVTWKANGATVRTDENIVDGNKVASVPSAPSDLTSCDAEFVGWVIEANDPGALSISSQSSTPSGMFTNVAGSPAITGNVTFVAIYRQEQ